MSKRTMTDAELATACRVYHHEEKQLQALAEKINAEFRLIPPECDSLLIDIDGEPHAVSGAYAGGPPRFSKLRAVDETCSRQS